MTTIEPLRDGHDRLIRDVRVSVTDRCNFRCQYCMPAEGLPWLERDEVLSFEEIERLVTLLASMGVHDIRLTGGEPLVRREFPRLAAMLAAVPGDEHRVVGEAGDHPIAQDLGDRQVRGKLVDGGVEQRLILALGLMQVDQIDPERRPAAEPRSRRTGHAGHDRQTRARHRHEVDRLRQRVRRRP